MASDTGCSPTVSARGLGGDSACQRLLPHNPDNLSLIPVTHGGRRGTNPGNCYLLTQVVSCLNPYGNHREGCKRKRNKSEVRS